MKDNTVKCYECNVPLEFQDIERTDNTTKGIFECPKCHRSFII
jgi:hypothetical protein